MNILLVYVFRKHSCGIYLENVLRKKHYVMSFNLYNIPEWSNWRDRLPFFITKGIPITVNNVLKKLEKVPDVIIEVDGQGLFHLLGYKKCKIPSIGWLIDSYGPKKRIFHKNILNDFSYTFVSHKTFHLKHRHKKKDFFWLPVAYDPEVHKKYLLKKKYDIVFVGRLDSRLYSTRVKLLKRLSKSFNVKIFQNVFGEEMAKIYSQAKIVFNKAVYGELNMRIFEALSCGSLLFTNYSRDGLFDIFENKKHLVAYKDDNLEELAEYYLKHESEREKIALAGQKEVHSKHNYEHRTQQMLKIVKNI